MSETTFFQERYRLFLEHYKLTPSSLSKRLMVDKAQSAKFYKWNTTPSEPNYKVLRLISKHFPEINMNFFFDEGCKSLINEPISLDYTNEVLKLKDQEIKQLKDENKELRSDKEQHKIMMRILSKNQFGEEVPNFKKVERVAPVKRQRRTLNPSTISIAKIGFELPNTTRNAQPSRV